MEHRQNGRLRYAGQELLDQAYYTAPFKRCKSRLTASRKTSMRSF
ncbi:MAG: hypothetical protein ACLS7Z_08740 [Christensenellales bacterium]